MKGNGKRVFQTQQFAELTGVTVRTLHHYDRLGLLKPGGHTAGGYRLYGESELTRLEQIVMLKFIGLPLKEIKKLLDQQSSDLVSLLRRQRNIIAEKRRQLDLAIAALEQAETLTRQRGQLDWEAFKKIIEVVNMEKETDWIKRYYTEEQLADLAKRGTPELLAQYHQQWQELISEIEASLNEDPASEKAQALAARWSKLIEAFTNHDPGIAANLKRLYADQANWPATFKKPFSDEVQNFISRAIAARDQKNQ